MDRARRDGCFSRSIGCSTENTIGSTENTIGSTENTIGLVASCDITLLVPTDKIICLL